MKIYSEFLKLSNENLVFTIGTFDGLHLGHRKILNQLLKLAKNLNAKTAVISFKEPPKNFFNKQNKTKLLSTEAEKINLFSNFNIDYLFLIDFDEKIANQTAEEFLKFLLTQYKIVGFVIGFNHKFGKDRKGDSFLLSLYSKQYKFEFVEVFPFYLNNEIVSSSLIRHLISQGQIKKANLLLGYKYSISGKVIKGNGLGKKIGFPTANIQYDKRKILPSNGVYATLAEINNQIYWSMTNVGFKPTVNDDLSEKIIETHILGFKKDIYGENLKISFIKKVREEKKFENLELLKRQIQKDKQIISEILMEIN